VVVAAAGSAAPSAGADPAAGDATDGTALPYTGQRATPELLAGICLIGIGLLLLAAARRRQELERLVWPDQR
jgi:LPXTG-motif cell wall-anchored protein